MKCYEDASRTSLPPRLPVILRVDGKAFKTYTRDCRGPFDATFNLAMDQIALDLCKLIQGAEMAYVQSDEVSVLIHGYKRFASQSWFDGQIQKICSVAASQASVTMTMYSSRIFQETRPALFDARAFVIPEPDVANYFVWRQQDAERNSTQKLTRHLYSHNDVNGKNIDQMRKMCAAKGSPWEEQNQGDISGRIVRRVPSTRTSPVTNDPIEGFPWDLFPARGVQWQDFLKRLLETEE